MKGAYKNSGIRQKANDIQCDVLIKYIKVLYGMFTTDMQYILLQMNGYAICLCLLIISYSIFSIKNYAILMY